MKRGFRCNLTAGWPHTSHFGLGQRKTWLSAFLVGLGPWGGPLGSQMVDLGCGRWKWQTGFRCNSTAIWAHTTSRNYHPPALQLHWLHGKTAARKWPSIKICRSLWVLVVHELAKTPRKVMILQFFERIITTNSACMPCPIVLNLSFSYWEMSEVFSALLFDIFEASLVFLKKNFLLMLVSNFWQNVLKPHQHLLRKTNHSLPFLFLGIYKSRFPMKKARFIWKSFLMRHRSSSHDLEEIRHGQLLEKCKIGLKME